MDDPLQADLHARIRQTFLLGLARQPLVVPPRLAAIVGHPTPEHDPALALLALTGQRQRFALPQLPPANPVPDAARRMHEDARPILPQQARRALSRLVASVDKTYAGIVLSIAVRRVGEAGCRAHPFDLPGLARYIMSDAGLGLAERAYLALTASESDGPEASSLFFETITADNWTTFPKANRRAFIVGVRHRDAGAGRALVEAVWKTEQAPMRVALLEALATGLEPDDKPFLDGLVGDRAETVRQTAAQLLARMPSTEGYRQRLAAAAACFRRPAKGPMSGLLSAVGLGGAGLTFGLSEGTTKGVKNAAELQGARERLFTGLRLAELAEAVGVTPDEIVEALPMDEHHVLTLLIDSAVADGNTATAQRMVGHHLLSTKVLSGRLLMHFADRARVMLTKADAEQFLLAPTWIDMIKALRETTTPAQLKDDGRFLFGAVLMPRAAMSAFVQSISELGPGITRAAKDFADLMLALPIDTPRARPDVPIPAGGARL
jgi:Family of unknown function (DUF5691)